MTFDAKLFDEESPYRPPPKHNRQTLMFSATFPTSIQQLAKEFLRHYTWVGGLYKLNAVI
jgi:superfamily II DNA/RNA helicase